VDKILCKKRQHKNSPIKNKINVVEFENILDNKLYQGSLPITKQDVAKLNYSDLINEESSILFWIKKIVSSKYTTNVGLADHSSFNK
jgi:hypothetical protein